MTDEDARRRAIKRMSFVDALSFEMRALVHEHGLTVVTAFLDCGVRDPRRIRHLINTVRGGSYEIGNRSEQPSQMSGHERYKRIES